MVRHAARYYCEQCGNYHAICRHCGKGIIYEYEWTSHPCTWWGRLLRLFEKWLP